MTESKRIFTITITITITNNKTGRSYILNADPWTTLDLAWMAEKCWFMPGSSVTITDDKGNSKTFVKEK